MDTESLITITYWWYTLTLMLLKKLKVCFRKESPFLPHHYFKIKAILINLPNEKHMWQQQNLIRTFKLYFLSWAICLSDPCRKCDWSFQETPVIPTFYRTYVHMNLGCCKCMLEMLLWVFEWISAWVLLWRLKKMYIPVSLKENNDGLKN